MRAVRPLTVGVAPLWNPWRGLQPLFYIFCYSFYNKWSHIWGLITIILQAELGSMIGLIVAASNKTLPVLTSRAVFSVKRILKCIEITVTIKGMAFLSHITVLPGSSNLRQDCTWFTREFVLHLSCLFSLLIYQEFFGTHVCACCANTSFVTSHTTGWFYCISNISNGFLHLRAVT